VEWDHPVNQRFGPLTEEQYINVHVGLRQQYSVHYNRPT